jgi:glycosyltransferase involved in cell wall biosynthesis
MKRLIPHRVTLDLVIWLAVCTANITCAENKHFAVIIPSWNNSAWCSFNIGMLAMQDYDNWHAIYINDASTDDTGKKVAELIKYYHLEDKITLINNETRQGAMANIYKAVHMCNNADVIINCDGDDWFSNTHVLSILNDAYADGNVWMTYGSYQYLHSGARGECASPFPDEVVQRNNYRNDIWRTSHLRTFYAWLFKCIKTEDLMVDGAFVPMSCDQAIMYPLIEMSGGRFKYIEEILYVYNMISPLNDHKVNQTLQVDIEKIIKARAPYQPLINIVVR